MVAAVDSEILSLSNGLHMRAELQSQFEGHAEITQPDFWCESCSLSMLPRRVTAE
jgi:hypothetical protein